MPKYPIIHGWEHKVLFLYPANNISIVLHDTCHMHYIYTNNVDFDDDQSSAGCLGE